MCEGIDCIPGVGVGAGMDVSRANVRGANLEEEPMAPNSFWEIPFILLLCCFKECIEHYPTSQKKLAEIAIGNPLVHSICAFDVCLAEDVIDAFRIIVHVVYC